MAIAERFLYSVQHVIETLAVMPKMGAPCSFHNPRLHDLRRHPVNSFENWLLFYRANDDEIEIIRVLHGARDLEAILSGQDSSL